MQNFVEYCLDNNGLLKPIIFDTKDIIGPSLSNPSIYNDNGQLKVNVRNLNYTLYHAENTKFQHTWGSLVYVHREDDVTLTTNNFIVELDDDCNVTSYYKTDTSELDVEPMWEFIGLEDARIVRWEDKFYQCGVRRDTTTTGVGRMELSEIVDNKEISRFRIPAPNDDDSYCEKNWMPVVDQPYTFVKWCNPTEVVKVDPKTKTCETTFLGEHIPDKRDWRGGSQVIELFGHYVCLVHETELWFTETNTKNARYRHRFLVWDKQWNFIRYSSLFSFMSSEIEFCCGMTKKENDVYISFGYQDNAAFVVKVDETSIQDFIYDRV